MSGSNADRWIVTTPRRRYDLNKRANETAGRLGLKFVARQADPYEKIFEETGAEAAYVETDDYPIIHTRAGDFYFHINTAGRRTKNVEEPDTLIRALEPLPGDHILDATLGIACDALVVATRLTTGIITGVESNLLLADLARRGLNDYDYKRKEYLKQAALRIEVVNADHKEFLRGCADGEYDLIYFDPMFEETVVTSNSMQRQRAVADMEPLSTEAVSEAKRVAKRRIVIKGRRGRFLPVEFDRILSSGKTIFYGIIDV